MTCRNIMMFPKPEEVRWVVTYMGDGPSRPPPQMTVTAATIYDALSKIAAYPYAHRVVSIVMEN